MVVEPAAILHPAKLLVKTATATRGGDFQLWRVSPAADGNAASTLMPSAEEKENEILAKSAANVCYERNIETEAFFRDEISNFKMTLVECKNAPLLTLLQYGFLQ